MWIKATGADCQPMDRTAVKPNNTSSNKWGRNALNAKLKYKTRDEK
jgi:hypothetical protein